MQSVWRLLLIACSGVLPLGCLLIPAEAQIEPLATDAPSAQTVEVVSPEPIEPVLVGPSPVEVESIQTFPLPVVIEDAPETDTTAASETLDVIAQPEPEAAVPEVETLSEEPPTVEEDAAVEETVEPETDEPETEPVVEIQTEEERAAAERRRLLAEGDRLYREGQRAAAEQLYRQAKGSPEIAVELSDRPEPILSPEQLSPAGQVYWREAATGREMGLQTRILVPLRLLVDQSPEFIPGQIRLAEELMAAGQSAEALQRLEEATRRYPHQPELVQARTEALAQQEEWLEAAIVARQFAVLSTDEAASAEFMSLADRYQGEFEADLRGRIRRNAIANVFTGAIGYALTGGLFGPFSAVETTALMLRGESAVGASIADRAGRQLDLVEDEVVVAYVNEVGQRLANVAGRDEFEYEFHVVEADVLNAFALPGGKIFINAGAITRSNSEAELAGLIAHEIAHAVLSHGFQLVTGGNLTANLLQFVPYGGTAANLAVLSYSRDMEREADELGTRILATAGYAADGLQNLMVTLEEQNRRNRTPFSWLSTHPDTNERVRNIEAQIERSGYNRYAYEGVERHQEIQARVREILRESKESEESEESEE